MKKIGIDLKECQTKEALFEVLRRHIPVAADNFDALHDALGDICRVTRIHVTGAAAVHAPHIDVLLRVLADSADENPKLSVLFDQKHRETNARYDR